MTVCSRVVLESYLSVVHKLVIGQSVIQYYAIYLYLLRGRVSTHYVLHFVCVGVLEAEATRP